MASTQIALTEHSHLLPPLLLELIDCIGMVEAIKLVEALGGCKIKVPQAFNPEHWLLETISNEALGQLTRDFSGMDIDIPRGYKSMLAVRNQRIKNDRKTGASIRQLAQRNKLTERQIYSILGAEVNDQQLNIFN